MAAVNSQVALEQREHDAVDAGTLAGHPGTTLGAILIMAGAAIFLVEAFPLFIENLLSYLGLYFHIAGDTPASIWILGVEAAIGFLVLAFSLHQSIKGLKTKAGYAYFSLILAVFSTLLYGELPLVGYNGVALGYLDSIAFILIHAPLITAGLVLVVLGSVLAIFMHEKQ